MNRKGNWITHDGDMFYKTQTTLSKQGIQIITMTPISIYRLLVLYGVLTMMISSIAILLVVWFVAPKIVAKSLQPFDGLVALMASKKRSIVILITSRIMKKSKLFMKNTEVVYLRLSDC